MVETLVPFVAAVLALLIIPGPDMALVMANGVAYGKRGAFFSSLGISCGGMVLALVVAVVLATALSINTKLLTFIQSAGCLYLLYIAAVTIYPKASDEAGRTAAEPSKGNLFLRGVVTNRVDYKIKNAHFSQFLYLTIRKLPSKLSSLSKLSPFCPDYGKSLESA